MLIVISPAKTLDFTVRPPVERFTIPQFIGKAEKLINELRSYSPGNLEKLMKISNKLANLNYERFQQWRLPFTPENALQCVFAFKGDVYTGLEADRMNETGIDFMQNHLRILSGLYGVLRPLDLIQPYRLEMGTPLKSGNYDNLYGFWGDLITGVLKNDLANGDGILINLASNEYFKAVNTEKLGSRVITPVFKEYKNGKYKFLSVYGKKARGLMVRYIITNGILEPDGLKLFDWEGYYYNDNMSTENEWVFTRG